MRKAIIQRIRRSTSPSEATPPLARREIRYYIFLRDVLYLALTSFGGPQVHIAFFIKILVEKHRYLTESELFELNALCQILPGPTSTQTLTAIAFKIGGPRLAFLTLLIWILPAVIVMTLAAMLLNYAQSAQISLEFTRYLQPVAVGFLLHTAYSFAHKFIQNKTMAILMVLAAMIAYFYPLPWITPIVLLLAGGFTAMRYKNREAWEPKEPFRIEWANFVLYSFILVTAAILGHYTQWLPIRLFENFYRNGSLIFGGGQVLVPVMYNEFVEFKGYLSSQEFLSGYMLSQTLPGPVFSFCSYIGALSMRQYGIGGQILGSAVASVGIFLPGTLLIFFIIRFWEQLKRFRVVKASLHGINAAGAGLLLAAALLLLQPVALEPINGLFVVATFVILEFTKWPAFFIMLAAMALGLAI